MPSSQFHSPIVVPVLLPFPSSSPQPSALMAEKHVEHVEAQVVSLKAELLTVMESQNLTLQTLQEDVAVLKKALLRTSPQTTDASPNVRIPEPKGFDGTRSAKELENFLWDMEQFFRAA